MATATEVAKIAAEAQCDARTVRSFLEGKRIRGEMLTDRIRAAMKKLKISK
jgi:hypothetical protein